MDLKLTLNSNIGSTWNTVFLPASEIKFKLKSNSNISITWDALFIPASKFQLIDKISSQLLTKVFQFKLHKSQATCPCNLAYNKGRRGGYKCFGLLHSKRQFCQNILKTHTQKPSKFVRCSIFSNIFSEQIC